MIFTYELPEDYPQEYIGVYDKKSGDSPHDLIAFNNTLEWKAPALTFDAPLSRIDAIPSTNMPVNVFRKEITEKISEVTNEEISVIPVSAVANGKKTDEFFIIHPVKRIEIWDLEASDWKGLDMAEWPKDRPIYMHNMLLKKDSIEPFKIAYNKNWTSMLVFNEEVAEIIKTHSKWVRIISPDNYNNA